MADTPEPVVKALSATGFSAIRMRRLNWSKLGRILAGLTVFWIGMQHLLPDWWQHVIGTIMMAAAPAITFMIRSQKHWDPDEDTNSRSDASGR